MAIDKVLKIEGSSITWTCKQVVKMIDKETISFKNVVQRSFVWERHRMSELIWSIIMRNILMRDSELYKYILKQEKPAVRFELRTSHRKGLERREVEKRIYGVKGNGSRLPLPFMIIG